MPRAAGLLLTALALATGCAGPSDADRIRAVIVAGERALEDGRVDDAAEHLSPHYADRTGRDKAALVLLTRFALRHGPVAIWIADHAVEVQGDTAVVRLDALVVQRNERIESLADVIPQDARRLPLELRFAREGRTWRVVAVDDIEGGVE